MHPSTKLSKNFRLAEFIKSGTAIRLQLDNTPTEPVIGNLHSLANNICQPIRDHFGRVVHVNSGYRSIELNRVLGSSDSSQHIQGLAVDLEIRGISNYDLAVWIKDNLVFDQLILEFYESGQDASGWVHISYKPNDYNRQQCLTINSKSIQIGLHK